jgi:hypothetical protein
MKTCFIVCRDRVRADKWVNIFQNLCRIEKVIDPSDTKNIVYECDFALVHSSDRYHLWEVHSETTVIGPKDSPNDCFAIPNSKAFLFTREGTNEGYGLIPIHRSTSPFDLNTGDAAELLQYATGVQNLLPKCCRPEENFAATALAILIQAYLYLGLRTKKLEALRDEVINTLPLPAGFEHSDAGAIDASHIRLWEHLQSFTSWNTILCKESRLTLEQALEK